MDVQQQINLNLIVGNEPANVFSRKGAVASYGRVPATEKLVDKQSDTILRPPPTPDENGNAKKRDTALNQAFSLRTWHCLQRRINDEIPDAENPP
jgi:hypothetical protein